MIRDLPDDIHAALKRRVEGRGQSLQQYLSAELSRPAERPTVDEVLARIAQRSGGQVGLTQAVTDLANERGRE